MADGNQPPAPQPQQPPAQPQAVMTAAQPTDKLGQQVKQVVEKAREMGEDSEQYKGASELERLYETVKAAAGGHVPDGYELRDLRDDLQKLASDRTGEAFTMLKENAATVRQEVTKFGNTVAESGKSLFNRSMNALSNLAEQVDPGAEKRTQAGEVAEDLGEKAAKNSKWGGAIALGLMGLLLGGGGIEGLIFGAVLALVGMMVGPMLGEMFSPGSTKNLQLTKDKEKEGHALGKVRELDPGADLSNATVLSATTGYGTHKMEYDIVGKTLGPAEGGGEKFQINYVVTRNAEGQELVTKLEDKPKAGNATVVTLKHREGERSHIQFIDREEVVIQAVDGATQQDALQAAIEKAQKEGKSTADLQEQLKKLEKKLPFKVTAKLFEPAPAVVDVPQQTPPAQGPAPQPAAQPQAPAPAMPAQPNTFDAMKEAALAAALKTAEKTGQKDALVRLRNLVKNADGSKLPDNASVSDIAKAMGNLPQAVKETIPNLMKDGFNMQDVTAIESQINALTSRPASPERTAAR